MISSTVARLRFRGNEAEPLIPRQRCRAAEPKFDAKMLCPPRTNLEPLPRQARNQARNQAQKIVQKPAPITKTEPTSGTAHTRTSNSHFKPAVFLRQSHSNVCNNVVVANRRRPGTGCFTLSHDATGRKWPQTSSFRPTFPRSTHPHSKRTRC